MATLDVPVMLSLRQQEYNSNPIKRSDVPILELDLAADAFKSIYAAAPKSDPPEITGVYFENNNGEAMVGDDSLQTVIRNRGIAAGQTIHLKDQSGERLDVGLVRNVVLQSIANEMQVDFFLNVNSQRTTIEAQ